MVMSFRTFEVRHLGRLVELTRMENRYRCLGIPGCWSTTERQDLDDRTRWSGRGPGIGIRTAWLAFEGRKLGQQETGYALVHLHDTEAHLWKSAMIKSRSRDGMTSPHFIRRKVTYSDE